jgi:hypothetical protein
MTLTPPRKRDYALVPAMGVGAVAMFTILFGTRFLRPPVYLASWFEFLVLVGTFLIVSAGFYKWRLWRRDHDATAYSIQAAGAWSLDEDWRHQLGLWAMGLIIGGLVLICLRLAYGLGWLRFAWPN